MAGGRGENPDDVLCAGELAAWRAWFDLEVEVTVDAGPKGWWPLAAVRRV